ncbi:MAG: Gfo/Idh/MocA family oxidoreductase [Eubacterium sp.]|nr:Gfo/Idh/MocA family oxidoreductase [Oscillospiraceae bacterium]MDD6355863.1 Gfo/Idh/MocA family oxidoreductase [Oscillospiraceae bacterium]MDY4608109.1 Gfo/Idh/MocA family oxidoreductase [Eubacterium sp.]
MEQKPVTAIIVGAGHRAFVYSKLAKTDPDKLKIVGVADPNPVRRQKAMEEFGFGEDMCFESADELAERGKLADAIINGTMDEQHLVTSVPLLNAGYDMLLEKPFAVNEKEMRELVACAKKNNSKVMICHVLRYTPFYYGIKEIVNSGEIGDIINIQTTEHVSYHHLSTSYVRGKWANSKKCHTSMLLAKCCHDLDIMMWMMSETKPKKISSFGGKFQFKPENAPAGAGTICMKDCPLVDTCVYSTKRLYIDHPDRWAFYVWDALEGIKNPTIEDKINLMKSDSPYARCIYKCDNDVVDHQSVMVEFESGATGTHNMVGGSSEPRRDIHIIGTKGEIFGNFEDSKFTVLKINPSPDAHNEECDVEEHDLRVTGDMVGAYGGHGGGDERLAADFVKFIRGEEHSLACTSIFDSVAGHLSVYLADQSRENGGEPQTVEL